MDDKTMCYGCMTMQQGDVCPNCGYDRKKPINPTYLPPGTMLADKYLIGKVIGHGGFGITYLAYDTVLGIKLAVKEYFVQEYASRGADNQVVAFAGDAQERFEEGIRRFLDEARILAMFEGNPGIVSVRDFFRANSTAYMVTVYLEGMNLRQYLVQNGPMPYERVKQEIIPVLTNALSVVHSAGLLHRDVSPDNIIITNYGQVKILDFGAARQLDGTPKSMSIILKPGYAPEEQYRSHGNQGPWTDVYAVAATIYRAITGKVPPESLDRLEHDMLEPPSKYCRIPVQEEAVLLKAMSVRAADRYQSMREFHNALLEASQEAAKPSGYGARRGDARRQSGPNPATQGMQEPEIRTIEPVLRPQRAMETDQKRAREKSKSSKSSGLAMNTVKIVLMVAIILCVLAAAFVIIRMLIQNISGIGEYVPPLITDTSPSAGQTTTVPPVSVAPTPSPSLSPTLTEELTPSPSPTVAPTFPDVSGIVVSGGTGGTGIESPSAYVPAARQEIALGVPGQGNIIYVTAKSSNEAVIVSQYVRESASLRQGWIEHFFIRGGSLYSYEESTATTALLIPSGATEGMSWTDGQGSKQIISLSATCETTVSRVSYDNCLIIQRVQGGVTYYDCYQRGKGLVAIVDDYHNPTKTYLYFRFFGDEQVPNYGTELDSISRAVQSITAQ